MIKLQQMHQKNALMKELSSVYQTSNKANQQIDLMKQALQHRQGQLDQELEFTPNKQSGME